MSEEKIREFVNRYDKLSTYLDKTLSEAKYTPVINDELEEADELPEEMYGVKKVNEVGEEEEQQDQMPPENLGAPPPEGVAPEMGGEMAGAGADAQPAAPDMGGEMPPEDATPPEEGQPTDPDVDLQATPVEPDAGMDAGMMEQPPQPTKDEVQNDIIKLQLSAMEKMHGKLDSMERQFNEFQAKMAEFDRDVEEVREPSNEEKLANKKQDSYPFKYNLNDMWKDNWFMARQDQFEKELPKGITKIDDDTYIGDFNSFPKLTDNEINDSFNI